MALGDLSPDQLRFVDLVSQSTGLSRNVVTSWVGTESGWGVTKGNHNYLNVGPGENYRDVGQAANRVAGLVNTAGIYQKVKASIPAGEAAQVQAIGSSKWGTSGSLLQQVHGDLLKKGGASAQPVGFLDDFVEDKIGDAAGGVLSALDLDKLLVKGGEMALALVFTVGALALIGLGVSRLTSVGAGKAMETTGNVVDKASTLTDLLPQGRAVGAAVKGAATATKAGKVAKAAKSVT